MEDIHFTQMEVHGIMKHVNVIGLKHYLHSSIEKSLMERVNQYFKDRIESFDNYYQCIQKETMNVTYFRYKIEYNSLYMYNYTISTRDNYFVNQLQKEG